MSKGNRQSKASGVSRTRHSDSAQTFPKTTDLDRSIPRRGVRLLLSLAVAANILPAVLLFYFVHRFGVDLPWWDEWDALWVPLQEFDQGRLGVSTLLMNHMEHRPLFPRLLTLANAALFHWNRTAEMYITAALLIFCAWLLYRFARAYWAHPLTPLLFVPIAWTLLGWRQWENLLMGMGTLFSLLAAGTVLAFFLLQRARRTDRFVLAAAAAAFVASFSSGGGLFLWPVGLAQLVLQRLYGEPGNRPGPGAFVVWTGAGTLTWALFFFKYNPFPLPYPTGFAYLIHNPIQTGRYVASMIGSPLSFHQPMAQSLGFIMTVLGAWVVFRLRRVPRDLVAAAPLLALLALTLLYAVTSCDRRMGQEFIAALHSRYCSLTALGIVALYALLVKSALVERRPATLLACGGIAAFLVAGAMTNFICFREDPAVQARLDQFVLGTYAIRYPEVVCDEAVSVLRHTSSVVRERIPFLRAHGYSLFHQGVPTGLPARYNGSAGGCQIEAVNGRGGSMVDVRRSDDSFGLRVTGWAVDLAAGQEPSRLFVSIDGRIDVPAMLGRLRPDVAGALGNPNYGASGYISYVRTSMLTVGEHALGLTIVSHDGSGYWTCSSSAVSRLRVAE